MKKNHGSILFLLLILLVVTKGSAKESKYCSYTITSTKKTAFVHEPINVSFFTKQKIHNEVMFFDLVPLTSDAYDIVSIKEKRHEYNYHDAKKEFDYLVIPKKSGKIDIKFHFQIRRASDDAVAQAYTGSRDNVKAIPTIKVSIDTPSISIIVKPIARNIQAVGDFNFSMKVDKNSSSSYDAVNAVYTLQGVGYLNPNFRPIKEIKNVSIFRGIKEQEPRATEDGYIYQKEWSYALVSDNNFTINRVELKSYNYQEKKTLDLSLPQRKITIVPLKIKDLIDEEEFPLAEFNYKKYTNYFYYFLIFIAGFLLAKFLDHFPKKSSKKKQTFKPIQNAKTPKELLNVALPLATSSGIHEEIKELEDLLYSSKSSKDITAIKLAMIKKIKMTN